MSKKGKIRKLLYVIGIISGGAFLIYQLILAIKAIPGVEFSQNALLSIISSIILAFFGIGLQIVGWFVLINSGNFTINLISVVKGYSVSFLPRYLPGTILGYISRSEWLLQKYSIPFTLSNSISIWEIISSLIANILIVLFYLINRFLPAARLLVIALPLIPLLLHKILNLLFFYLNKKRLRIFGKILKIDSIPIQQWYLCVLSFLFHWLLLGFSLLQILLALGVSDLNFLKVVFSGNLSWLSGFFVFFAPAGLGYREATLSYLLTDLFKISEGVGNIASSFFRLITILAELIWIITGILVGKRNNNRM